MTSTTSTIQLEILGPDAAGRATSEFVGGKAAQLAELTAHGLPVPTWRCIPADVFRQLLEVSTVAAAVAAARELVGADGSLDPVADTTPNELLHVAFRATLDADTALASTLLSALTDVGGPVAVRSSAVGEDGAAHSFAGQFETVLGVRTEEDFLDAVCACWASALSDRVIAYRVRHDMDPFDVAMAVVVQKMVAADVAGVLFGADPTDGDPDVILISATWGLGEALVSGIANADTHRILADGSITTDIADKDLRIVMDATGTTREESVEESMRHKRALTDAQVRELGKLAVRLAVLRGGPQDVEWAYVGGELHLLQSRAITSKLRPRGEHRLWDNSNIIESYGGIVSPLTFTFANEAYAAVYDQFTQMLGIRGERYAAGEKVFDQMLGYLDGRVYYNLRNWYLLISLLPGYAMNQRFMEQMMGVREAPDPRLLPQPQKVGKVRDTLGLVEAGFRLWWSIRRLKRTIPPFRARVRELQMRDRDKLATMHTDELVEHYIQIRDQALGDWKPPLVNDFGCMLAFGVLGKLIEKYELDETGTLKNELLAGQGGVESTEPTHRLVEMAGIVRSDSKVRELVLDTADDELLDVLAACGTPAAQQILEMYEDYLERYGDRCVNELKLETPTLRENPAFLMSVLRNFVEREDLTVDGMEARERVVRDAAESLVAEKMSGKPIKRWWLNVWLRQTRERVRQRENLRFDRTRVFGVARRVFVQIGERFYGAGLLEDPRDIFMLEVDEIIAIARGTSTHLDVPGLVTLRKNALERAEAERPTLPDRIRSIGPVLANPLTGEQAMVTLEGDAASGTGCCPGIVEKRVHVVHAPDQGVRIDGDIMVCERTDPGWVPLFPSCGGLLVERGSLLSHSAIVAREFGIPAIVGISGLMAWAEDGDVMRMDGATGTVERVSSAGSEVGSD